MQILANDTAPEYRTGREDDAIPYRTYSVSTLHDCKFHHKCERSAVVFKNVIYNMVVVRTQ